MFTYAAAHQYNHSPAKDAGGHEDPWPNLANDDAGRKLSQNVRAEEDEQDDGLNGKECQLRAF